MAAEASQARQAILAAALSSVVLALATVGLFLAGVFVLRSLGRPRSYSLAGLGFVRPTVGRFGGAAVGFLVGVGAVVLGGFLSALTTVFLRGFGYSAESTVQQPFMDSLEGWVRADPALAVPAIVAVVVILGPAAEEIAFRGGLYRFLKYLGTALSNALSGKKPGADAAAPEERKVPSKLSRLPAVLAAVLSSVFFALLHLEPVILPTLLVFALVLCYLLEKTRSLLPCIVAHATFNSFATVIIILSGLGVLEPLPV